MDINNQTIKEVLLSIDGKTFLTDDSGKAEFEMVFNETNYLKPRELEVIEGDKIRAQCEIDFFTKTPIIITVTNTDTSATTVTATPGFSLITIFLMILVIPVIITVRKSRRSKPKHKHGS